MKVSETNLWDFFIGRTIEREKVNPCLHMVYQSLRKWDDERQEIVHKLETLRRRVDVAIAAGGTGNSCGHIQSLGPEIDAGCRTLRALEDAARTALNCAWELGLIEKFEIEFA